MAFPRSLRSSIISTRNDWRVGISKALMAPRRMLSAIDLPDLYDLGEDEEGEEQGLHQRQGLGDEEHAVPVRAVREDTGHGGQEKGGELPAEGHHAQQEGGIGDPVDEPAEGDPLHPGSDEGDALAVDEEAEVTVAQRPQHGLCAPRPLGYGSIGRHQTPQDSQGLLTSR